MGEWKYSSMNKPQHGKEISDQRHALAALFSGKEPLVPILYETFSMQMACLSKFLFRNGMCMSL